MAGFGIRKTSGTVKQSNLKCQTCGSEDTVTMVIKTIYLTLLWIPFIPLKKTGLTQCTHCKHQLDKSDFNADYRAEYQRLAPNVKIPKWGFTGLVLLTLILPISIYNHSQTKKQIQQYMAEPKKGDLYSISKAYKSYTLYKIERVVGDTLYFLKSEFETTKSGGLEELEKKGFTTIPVPVLKSEIQEWNSRSEIRGIERKE